MYKDSELTAIALLVAEHEVMRNRLRELDELCVELTGDRPVVPLRWKGNGELLVDLPETIKKFMENKNESNRKPKF